MLAVTVWGVHLTAHCVLPVRIVIHTKRYRVLREVTVLLQGRLSVRCVIRASTAIRAMR